MFRCQMRHQYACAKPTLFLVKSMTTTSNLYDKQFEEKAFTEKMNLIAIDLLATWLDSTIRAFHLSSSIPVKVVYIQVFALVHIAKVGNVVHWLRRVSETMRGHFPNVAQRHTDFRKSGSYDRTSELGCWDGLASLKAAITNWITTKPTPDFQSSDEYCDYLIDTGLGEGCDAVAEAYWVKAVKADCQDEDDLKRIRIVAINLVGRDSLYTRLPDSTCPVLWMHRTKLPCIV
ncbi:uncharacterized protein RAG0_07777 [Rhynchosporium agropyri]|uniref:Uncharacterized protein n=1 Tax=Rhynchosporium agropyri TaxID=914238 RepID=A0A1E1KN60_9HELO|nr:uncharacterized protein RAG0_07777 [Rhynchosporium agropyri]